MRHLQHGRMWLEMIVDPAREHRRFHRCAPRLRQRAHPVIQVQTSRGNRTLGVNPAAAVLHAVADLPLVNIQADVIHRLHGGASLVSLNQRLLSSAFSTPSAPPSTYTFKLIGRSSTNSGIGEKPELIVKTVQKFHGERVDS